MKKCKSCQTEIDDKAKKCPHCQADQRSWFGRHPVLTVIGGLILFSVIASSSNSSGDKQTTTTGVETQSVKQEAEPTVTREPTFIKPTASPTTKPITAKPTIKPVEKKASDVSGETISQKNAVKKAKSYLGFSAFSHDGLVAQLEYEQFSHADAVYGADNSGANWNEQAAKKAKSYMEYSAFSRGSLIEQLKYEKFTQEQAEYGANAVGL